MIAALFAIGAASADPIALRAPLSEGFRGAEVVFGAPSSAIAWRNGTWGVCVDAAPTGAIVGASAGVRRAIVRNDGDMGVDIVLAGGVIVPLIDPGVGVNVTTALQAGWFGDRSTFAVGLAAPIAVRLAPGVGIRVPLLAEALFAARAGDRWDVGLITGAGVAMDPDAAPAIAGEAAVIVARRW